MSAGPGSGADFAAVADQAARELAQDPARSFLVEAPAGSGKTSLLTRRFLRLLSVVDRPEAVVALTFTRKAAAEMRDRVLKALRLAQSDEEPEDENEQELRKLGREALARDAARNWRVLEHPSDLRIQTIDSLCATLTQEMPLQAALGGLPRVKEHAEELYVLAARRALAGMAGASPELRSVFRALVSHFESDLQRLEKQIAAMLGRREQWLDLIGRNAITRDLLNESLRDQARAVLTAAWALWPAGLPNRLAPEAEFLEQWRRFANSQLLASGKKARRRLPHTDLLDANPEFLAALDHARSDLPLAVDDQQWEIIDNFFAMLVAAAQELHSVFQERGEVDFTEITQAAIRALGTAESPTDLLYRLDYRIEHLLIDEFQDTSVSQYRLVEALTREWSAGDNRTLFVVGDPMQSIYGFRQAEVGLFLDAAHGRLGSVALERLQLTANFRSTRELTGWVNEHMRPAMKVDDRDNSAVSFRASEARRTDTGDEPQFQPFFGSNAAQEEAQWIAARAREKLEHGKKVAVLVRARSHVVEILRAFRQAEAGGVPYEAIEIDPLKEQQHILDVLSIARAILHVGDRVSWLACLRAPWCGLSLADLSALAEGQPDRTILELLEDLERLGALSPAGRIRAVRCAEILQAAVRQAGRRRVRNLVEAAWMKLGGPATLRGAEQHQDVEVLLELLDEFDEGGMIRQFSLIEDRLEFLYAKAQTGGDRVQVMTIHGAKGLEFDAVFLPQLNRSGPPAESPLLVWTESRKADGANRILMAGTARRGESDVLYQSVKRIAQGKERNEETRLFYVAATRARSELYLSACLAEKDDGSGYSLASSGFNQSPLTRYLLTYAKPFLDQAWRQRQGKTKGMQQLLAFPAARGTLLRRLPATWSAPAPPPAIQVAVEPEQRIASERRITYEWVEDTARHVGTIVHDYLRRFAEDGLGRWSSPRIEDERQGIESELRRLGTSTANLHQAVTRVLQALYNVLASERVRWFLAGRGDLRTEWAVSGVVNGQLLNATMDLTFVDPEGVRWIVDYKTSSHEGGGLEGFLEAEQRRYRPQLESYAALMRMSEERPIRLGLYFPLLDEWRSWAYEAAAGSGL